VDSSEKYRTINLEIVTLISSWSNHKLEVIHFFFLKKIIIIRFCPLYEFWAFWFYRDNFFLSILIFTSVLYLFMYLFLFGVWWVAYN
jgi:hypothetical protein